jgi:hypothetical protein
MLILGLKENMFEGAGIARVMTLPRIIVYVSRPEVLHFHFDYKDFITILGVLESSTKHHLPNVNFLYDCNLGRIFRYHLQLAQPFWRHVVDIRQSSRAPWFTVHELDEARCCGENPRHTTVLLSVRLLTVTWNTYCP